MMVTLLMASLQPLLLLLAQEAGPAPTRSWGAATFVAMVLTGATLAVSFLSSRRGHRD